MKILSLFDGISIAQQAFKELGFEVEYYPSQWRTLLKKQIRERDFFSCQICKKKPSNTVHHIDYEKQNCNFTNLVTLCKSCHGKTNFNRVYWKDFFKK